MNREEPADSGWLSTRNKRKITTPAASVKRKRSAVALCRPLGCGQPSAFYTLTQNSPPPPELFTRTHQTSIVSFFRAGSTKGNAEDAKAADVKSEGDEEPKKNRSKPDVDQGKNMEPLTYQTRSPLRHSPREDNSRRQVTDRQNNQVQLGEENQQPAKGDIIIDWYCNSNSPRKGSTECSPGSFLGLPGYKSRNKVTGSPGESQAFVTLELDSDGNFADLALSSQKRACSVKPTSLCSQDSAVRYSSSYLEDQELSEIASFAELDGQWGLNDSCVSKIDTAVTDSEEPFTFAFLSQDPTLRTRVVTPTGIRQSSKGADSASASDDEEFTLTTQGLDNTNDDLEYSDVSGFEDESQCILDSQELELEEHSIEPNYSEFKESNINSNFS